MEVGLHQNLPQVTVKINYEAKLRELLRNLTSVESQLYVNSCKEFVKILKSDSGHEFVCAYVQKSFDLVELFRAWDFRKGKPGFHHVLNVVSAILKHSRDDRGVGSNSDVSASVSHALDKFARSIIADKMGDLYKELQSKDGKIKNSVLLLLTLIVRRSSYFSSEVAKVFDFKVSGFGKLAEVRLRKRKVGEDVKKTFSTRKAFVGFAMSFLEVGNPRFLRGILQQKEMYSGVLRGLGNDDEETVVYVLSILRDRVLVPESSVPPGLRSVLFGSVTLEQLVGVSGRSDFVDGAELAHNVLVMVCTNPLNGLMPDVERQLCGNMKRLLDVMKKLKATEVDYHKILLLAIVKGRPLFGAAYLDEFPYNIEDLASHNWFAAIFLAADVVSSVNKGLSLTSVDRQSALDSQHMQNILRCMGPRSISRLVLNKGLLHSDSLVRHGTLKLVLEELKLLDSLVKTLDSSHPNNQIVLTEIENRVRVSLPDPQVLFSLLSPLNNHFKNFESTKKRKAEMVMTPEHNAVANKKLRTAAASDHLDIVISGVNSSKIDVFGDGEVADPGDEQHSEMETDAMKPIRDLWGVYQCGSTNTDLGDADTYFYSKTLDALKFYYGAMPAAMEGLFDLFKFLPNNPLVLPTVLQQSLLQLLNAYISQFYDNANSARIPLQMFKHLYPFIILLLFSPVRETKEQAYVLAKASMLSTGAFDHNTKEICAWFFFIPGYQINHMYTEELKVEIFLKLSSFIVSFLCDAISTTGNNLYKYMELLKHYLNDFDDGKDASLETSPFVVCVLEKCLRLLSSESGSFTLPQKSSISLYVCNTIKYILDTQVNPRPLSFVIDQLLSEKLVNFSQKLDDVDFVEYSCEWRPLKKLLHFARDNLQNLQKKYYDSSSYVWEAVGSNSTFIDALTDIKGVIRSEHDLGLFGPTVGYCFSLMCARPSELLQNFPLLLSISSKLHDLPFVVLGSIFFIEASYLDGIWKLWPEMVSNDLDSVCYSEEEEVKTVSEVDADSTEAGSIDFLRFLRSAPFHAIFSAIIQSRSAHIIEQTSLRKLLLVKLSEMPNDHLISSLCNILFWFSHTYYCYTVHFSGELLLLSETCFVLAEHLLKRLLADNGDTANLPCVKDPLVQDCDVELADTIFNHPTILQALNYPLLSHTDCPDSVWRETHEGFQELAKQGIHPMYHHVLNLIRTAAELLSQRFSGHSFDQVVNGRKRVGKAFNSLIRKFILIFKNDFDACTRSGDFKPLVPKCYALYSMIQFVSPSELLELVNWLFCRIDYVKTKPRASSKETSLFLCLQMTNYAFDLLTVYMGQPLEGCKLIGLLADAAETHFDVCLFERIFSQVADITFHVKLDIADACLLKAMKVVRGQKVIRHVELPSVVVLSKAVANIPVNIVSYCLNGMTRTKAELLHHVSLMSPLHMSVFGCVLCSTLGEPLFSSVMQETCTASLSDEELMMLLPTVSSYISSLTSKSRGLSDQPLQFITSTYGRVLFDGFAKWDKFVSGTIFNIKLDQSLHESAEELLNNFSDSLLGKAILMAEDHMASTEDMNKLERRLSLFNSVCLSSDDDDFFDYCGEPGLHSLQHPLEFVNRVVAKIKFCRILLFPDHDKCQTYLDDGTEKLIVSEVASEIENSRIQFLRKLVSSWTLTVKIISGNSDNSKKFDCQNLALFKFLEVFVMNNILELTAKMHNCLIKLSSLPFIEQLIRSFLVYKFGDLATIKMLRTLLSSLAYGNFSCASVIKLLLAHSQFTKSFQLGCRSLNSTQFGLLFTPLQSILKSHAIIHSDSQSSDITSQKNPSMLELVKLVRLLFHNYVRQRVDSGEGENEINFRELVYLLLSSYGATYTEVDLEIYNLILEIESSGKSTAGVLTEMDYLWGVASLKMRKDREQDKEMRFFDPTNMESFEEYRRTKFRENITIDPKLCAQTVLYFPYHRYVNSGTIDKLQKDSLGVVHEAHSGTVEEMQIYDPVFILHFSIHCLSMNYIEPIEFASLGLLAIAFVCISSPDVDMRKLGYEALAKFKSAVEKCRRKKDVARLRLLLSFLQNGIQEPWQRIPCIIAIFIAEASLTLLDPSHDNYSTISKYLMRSHAVNMKAIPLFEKLFWSSSVNHRTERLWMLRLLLVGLNMEDDTHIYIKDSIFQNLLSFYSSHLSDHDSKDLIVQILNKAVQSHKSLWFLVKHCGLILWLSSLVSSFNGSQCPGQKSSTRLPIILKIINHIISPRNIVEWLQEHAMEQLSELSSHLYKLIVGAIGLSQDNSFLCKSILQILSVLLKTSQKRKIYQPHFTLPVEGLFNLHEAVELCCSRTSCNKTGGWGLVTILMSTPPITIFWMDSKKLSKLLRWAVTIAISETRTIEESLASKLLRWLTASVILGKIYHKLNKFDPNTLLERPNLETMCSLLGKRDNELDENAVFDSENVLASSIIYLLQELGFSHSLLPSAVSALCLLFYSRSSSESEITVGPGISLSALCSKIHCPPEANPAWRWSYHQPWRDLSFKLSPGEKLDEIHACERLFRIVVSNMFPNEFGCSSFSTLNDASNLHVYDWERSLFRTE